MTSTAGGSTYYMVGSVVVDETAKIEASFLLAKN
jgi:hypothetical protein